MKRKADKIPGIKIVTLKGYLTKIPPGRVQIPDLIDFLIDYKADIIHAHGMGEQPAEEAFYAAKIKKIPFIFTLHFAPYDVYKKLNADHVWKVMQEYQVYNILRGADKIIAVSPNEKEDIKKYTGYTGNNFEVIPNGFDRPQEKVTPQLIKEIFKKYGIPEGRKYVVFLGALTNPRKGAFETIQAFRAAKSKIPDLFLILMGTWDARLNYAGLAKTTTKVLEKLAKANNVVVTGWLNEKDKYAILTGSNLFISPTYYEAFGIALCEALYSKIPVIASDRGGCKYVVRNGIDGRKMGVAGYERVRKMFSWEKTGEKLEGLYKNLFSSSS
ncbi:glycosyltransferase family 4 protein [Candidatus Roizmanbacteria bacterium]|nr:glycosyltransferase family 4 protein [Candidatus Roizmanbacteria bacterium]